MSIRNCSFVVLSALFLASCATNHFDRNEKFSESGSLYTDSVNTLLGKTKERLIEVNSELLLINPRKTKEGRLTALKDQNKSLATLLDKIDEFRVHNRLLGRYFTELRIVSDAGKSDGIGVTLAEISQTIANLNQKTISKEGYSIPLNMSYDQKSQIAGIADQMVKTHHAKRIQRQLRRDSRIIQTQLTLQSKQLDKLIDLMKDTIEEGNMLHLNTKVIQPYAKGEVQAARITSWKASRAHWFEMRRTESVFEKVKEAQLAMLWAWQDIVQGKRDMSSINQSLKDVNKFVRTMNAYKTDTYVSESYVPLN